MLYKLMQYASSAYSYVTMQKYLDLSAFLVRNVNEKKWALCYTFCILYFINELLTV